jgi:hypothetical protein
MAAQIVEALVERLTRRRAGVISDGEQVDGESRRDRQFASRKASSQALIRGHDRPRGFQVTFASTGTLSSSQYEMTDR